MNTVGDRLSETLNQASQNALGSPSHAAGNDSNHPDGAGYKKVY